MMTMTARFRPIPSVPKSSDRKGPPPYDGRFYLLAGDSGYMTSPLRVHVGRWYPEYRPHQPWQTHSDDDFTDDGGPPLYYAPLLEFDEVAFTSPEFNLKDDIFQVIAMGLCDRLLEIGTKERAANLAAMLYGLRHTVGEAAFAEALEVGEQLDSEDNTHN